MASLEEQVGALVRHHRKLAGLTQAQLAERVGRQTGAITRIETGEAAPSFETLSSLAEALSVEVRDFFELGSFAAREGRDDPLVQLVGRVSELSKSDIEWADRLIQLALSRKSRT